MKCINKGKSHKSIEKKKSGDKPKPRETRHL